MSKDRVEIFSDAVFAIIMTLLVLELKVPEIPEHAVFSDYITAMAPLVPKIIAFVLTFIMLCIHWVNHHYFFRHIRKTTVGMVWINNILLLLLCFLPFPTAMFGDHPTDQFPIFLYSVVSLLIALTFFALRVYSDRLKLFKEDKETTKYMGPKRSLPAIVLYAISIPLIFINVYVAIASLLIVPLIYFVPNLIPKVYKAAS